MTKSNDSDSITMRLSVKEIVALYNLVCSLDESVSVKIEQTKGSGIGMSTQIHLPPINLTDYESW